MGLAVGSLDEPGNGRHDWGYDADQGQVLEMIGSGGIGEIIEVEDARDGQQAKGEVTQSKEPAASQPLAETPKNAQERGAPEVEGVGDLELGISAERCHQAQRRRTTGSMTTEVLLRRAKRKAARESQ